MWNKRMPRKSCVVVIRECSRKGIVKESVAIYDERTESGFLRSKNGDIDGSNCIRNCVLLDWMCNGRFY